MQEVLISWPLMLAEKLFCPVCFVVLWADRTELPKNPFSCSELYLPVRVRAQECQLVVPKSPSDTDQALSTNMDLGIWLHALFNGDCAWSRRVSDTQCVLRVVPTAGSPMIFYGLLACDIAHELPLFPFSNSQIWQKKNYCLLNKDNDYYWATFHGCHELATTGKYFLSHKYF